MSPAERVVSQQHDIAAPLREAEAQIAIALARLSKLGPGGLARYGWAGSWADYQKIAQLLCKTRALTERIEHRQRRIPWNDSNARYGAVDSVLRSETQQLRKDNEACN